jgi:hypothetical protein
MPATTDRAFVHRGVPATTVGQPLRGCGPPRRGGATSDNRRRHTAAGLRQEARDRNKHRRIGGGPARRQPQEQPADHSRRKPPQNPSADAGSGKPIPQDREASDARGERQRVRDVSAARPQLYKDLLVPRVENRERARQERVQRRSVRPPGVVANVPKAGGTSVPRRIGPKCSSTQSPYSRTREGSRATSVA